MSKETDKIVGEIPESLRYDEAIAAMREKLKDDPKTDPHSAVATAACCFLMQGCDLAREDLRRFNAAIGGNYPVGDAVMVGALLAAASALSQHLIARDPTYMLVLPHIADVAERVTSQVASALEKVRSGKLKHTGVISDGVEMTVAIHRSHVEKKS